MPRPQFTLRSLLVAMLVVGAFFTGAAWQRRAYRDDRDDWESQKDDLWKAIEVLSHENESFIVRLRKESGSTEESPSEKVEEKKQTTASTLGYITDPAQFKAMRQRGRQGLFPVDLETGAEPATQE